MVSSGCNSHPLGSVLGWKSSHARALCWKLKFPEIDSECRRDVHGRARTQSRWRVAHALRRLWTTTPKAALASVVGPFQAVGMARASCIVHLTARLGTRARRKPLYRSGGLCCGCCGATTLLLPVTGRQASLAAVAAMATLADVCPHHETERGAAAKVLGRTGSEGVREGFREVKSSQVKSRLDLT